MKRLGPFAVSTILFSSVALPALAVEGHTVSVEFSSQAERNSGKRVDASTLSPRDPSFILPDRGVSFANGATPAVVTALSLQACGAVIEVPRLDWRITTNWARSHLQLSNCGSDLAHYESIADIDAGWTSFGSISFKGRVSHEAKFSGIKDSTVTTIGLLPLNDSAICENVTAAFSDGSAKTLALVNGNFLPENWITTLDLPSTHSALRFLTLNCHAERGGDLNIQIRGAD